MPLDLCCNASWPWRCALIPTTRFDPYWQMSDTPPPSNKILRFCFACFLLAVVFFALGVVADASENRALLKLAFTGLALTIVAGGGAMIFALVSKLPGMVSGATREYPLVRERGLLQLLKDLMGRRG